MNTSAATIASVLPTGEPPSEIMLFPAGDAPTRPHEARDGWVNDDPEAVVSRTAALGDLPIDYEHQTQRSEKNGQPAPAAGWIKRVYQRDGAIWGDVSWTRRAADMIRAGEYRYISPSFIHEQQTRRLVRIEGAGLVNDPALHMRAIARANTSSETETTMDMDKLREALGLGKDADDAAILSAAASAASAEKGAQAWQGTVAKAVGLGETATASEVAAAVAARHDGGDPDPQRFVPREEYDKAVARVNTIETERADEKATASVDAAVTAGKVSPGQRGDMPKSW